MVYLILNKEYKLKFIHEHIAANVIVTMSKTKNNSIHNKKAHSYIISTNLRWSVMII